MPDIFLYIFLLILLFGGGGGAFVRNQLESRRRHQLEVKRIDAEIARNNAEQAQAELTKQALEVRTSEIAIEQFDRGVAAAGGIPAPRLASGVEPDLAKGISDKAHPDDPEEESKH